MDVHDVCLMGIKHPLRTIHMCKCITRCSIQFFIFISSSYISRFCVKCESHTHLTTNVCHYTILYSFPACMNLSFRKKKQSHKTTASPLLLCQVKRLYKNNIYKNFVLFVMKIKFIQCCCHARFDVICKFNAFTFWYFFLLHQHYKD